jgi:DnaJ-class molecular chaperone
MASLLYETEDFEMNVNELETCPRCRGTGADPDQSGIPRRLPDDPISGERSFQVSVDPCHQCNGTGRISNWK